MTDPGVRRVSGCRDIRPDPDSGAVLRHGLFHNPFFDPVTDVGLCLRNRFFVLVGLQKHAERCTTAFGLIQERLVVILRLWKYVKVE